MRSLSQHNDVLPRSWGRLYLAVGVLVIAFFLVEHDLTASEPGFLELSADDKIADVESGNPLRRIALVALGLAGLMALLSRSGRRAQMRGALPLCWIALLLWCQLSLLWADDFALSARRLVAVGCLVLAGLAMARQFRVVELVWVSLLASLAFLVVGVAVEAALGNFHPTYLYYRFAGTLHPNTMGTVSALLCSAAVYLAWRSPRWRSTLWAVAALGLLLLLLTKSRASLGALAAAHLFVWSFKPMTARKSLSGLAMAWALCLMALALGPGLFDVAGGSVRIGRVDSDPSTFSGRTVLWEELVPYAEIRPWLGYGYGSFWTPQRIDEIAMPSWASSAAHNAYLDVLLSLGAIGLLLAVLTLALGIRRAAILARAHSDSGYGFFSWLLLFFLLHGALESTAYSLRFVPFMAFVGLTSMAFWCPQPIGARAAESAPAPVSPARHPGRLIRRPADGCP